GQRTDARGLSQLLGHGVAIFAKAFDLSIDRVDLPGQLLDRAQDRSQPREEILPDAVAYALRKCFRRARRQPRAQRLRKAAPLVDQDRAAAHEARSCQQDLPVALRLLAAVHDWSE